MSEYLKWHKYNDELKHWRNLLQGVVDDLKPIRTKYIRYLQANPHLTERKQMQTEITNLEIDLHKKIKKMKDKDINDVKSLSKEIISKKKSFNKLHKKHMNYRNANPSTRTKVLLEKKKEEYVVKIIATIDAGWDDSRVITLEQQKAKEKDLGL